MQEISLHILDLLENSIAAGADKITLMVKDDPYEDELTLVVTDNGCGMTAEQCKTAVSPFHTARTTRRVGLGLAFLEMAVTQCGGQLRIESHPGGGTEVMATFCHSHPDRQPLGDMASTITSALLGQENLRFEYLHIYKTKRMKLSWTELELLMETPLQLTNPFHLQQLELYIREQLWTIYGGESS